MDAALAEAEAMAEEEKAAFMVVKAMMGAAMAEAVKAAVMVVVMALETAVGMAMATGVARGFATVVKREREKARAACSAAADSAATESAKGSLHTKSADKYLRFTVPPMNSKPSSTLNATSQWSTSVPEPTPPKVMP